MYIYFHTLAYSTRSSQCMQIIFNTVCTVCNIICIHWETPWYSRVYANLFSYTRIFLQNYLHALRSYDQIFYTEFMFLMFFWNITFKKGGTFGFNGCIIVSRSTDCEEFSIQINNLLLFVFTTSMILLTEYITINIICPAHSTS